MVDDDTMGRSRRFADALQALDADPEALGPMIELFSEQSELTNSGTTLTGNPLPGTDGARTFWTEHRGQFEKAETEFHQLTAGEDGSAGLFWTTRGKAASGESLDYAGAMPLAFDREGLVTRFHGYRDTRQLVVEDLSGS